MNTLEALLQHIHVSRVPFPELPTSAEKALLLLLLEGEPWRAKVLEAVGAEEFEFPAYRAVFEAARADAPDRLDETAARAYEELKAEGLAGNEPDALFERALNWLEARKLERAIDELDRQLTVAAPDEQAALLVEKRRVFDALRVKFPRYKIAKRRSGAPGS